MTIPKERKQEIAENFKLHEGDTGSSNVQIALLTERINQITDHLKQNKKDHHSRRGLLRLVGRRRNLLDYLKSNKNPQYMKILQQLNLRR
jgi:small subunit ribosomal protein S15